PWRAPFRGNREMRHLRRVIPVKAGVEQIHAAPPFGAEADFILPSGYHGGVRRERDLDVIAHQFGGAARYKIEDVIPGVARFRNNGAAAVITDHAPRSRAA